MSVPMGKIDELPTPTARIIGELVREYMKNPSVERREQLMLTVHAVLHFMIQIVDHRVVTSALQEIDKQLKDA